MRDFQAYVRDSLGSLGIPEDRETAIIEEIAEHMRAAYEEAVAAGSSEAEAFAFAESAFIPWDVLCLDISKAEQTRRADTREIDTAAVAPQKRSWSGTGQMLATLWQDLSFGVRMFFKRPLFTATAIVTLGLGIGSATMIFSVVDAVLIRDLPYRDPDHLVSVWKAWPSWQGQEGLDYVWDHIQFTWVGYQNLKNHATTLSDVAAFMTLDFFEPTLTGPGEPERISVGTASANLFGLLGVRPVLGRDFLEKEVPPFAGDEGARVALLSHGLWSRRFGGTRDVLGQSISLNGTAFEVIGVLPPGIRVSSDVIRTHINGGKVDRGLRDVWIPLWNPPGGGNNFELLARLAPGVNVEQARAEIQTLMTVGPENQTDQVARVRTRKEFLTVGFSTPLFLLLGASGLLLLVACVNVAGLLVGEASGRGHEVALRYSLGAGRGRVVRQLLTESVMLGMTGAALGMVLAVVGAKVLLSVAPPLPRLEEVTLSGRMLLFALGAGVGTSLLFGLAPTSILAGRSVGPVLNTRGQSSGRRSRSLQAGVVSTQVALTVVLLVVGGLFGRSLLRLLTVDPGFDAAGLVSVEVAIMDESNLPEDEDEPRRSRLGRLSQDLVRVAEGAPGVLAATGASYVPFEGGNFTRTISLVRQGETVQATLYQRHVLPNYHRVMGIPLKSGRLFTEADRLGNPPVMLISQGLAERYWPGESPLGATAIFQGADTVTIVGVVGDVRKTSLGSEAEETFYVSALQYPQRSLTLVARTAGDPSSVVPSLRAALRSADPSILIGDPKTLTSLARDSESDDRFRAVLILTFAILATVLAAVGIFGITARSVASRKQELAIRMALGADSVALVGHVVRGGMMSAMAGLAVGLLGAFWAAKLIQHFLFGIDSSDPATYLSVSCILMLVCLSAAYLPASRVTGIAPMKVINEE